MNFQLRPPPPLTDKQRSELVGLARNTLSTTIPLLLNGARYAAAVITTNDEFFQGINYFSSTHSLSLHAEHVALAHAGLHGDPLVRAIAISSDDSSTIPFPCGLCRQLLWENARHSRIDMIVLLSNSDSDLHEYRLSQLYPLPWPARPPRGTTNG